MTNVAPNITSPRVGTSALGMTPAGSYPSSNISRNATGADSLLYTWSPVTSGSNYSYDVYLSWKTGLNPPVLSASAYISNYSLRSGAIYTATLTGLDVDAASQFIVGQYIEATPGVGGPPPTLGAGNCYVEAINLGNNTVDIVFPTGGAVSGAITDIKSKENTWLPFQLAGTTKGNSFSFQIKDLQTGGTAISDVQFVQALVSISTYPKYQNDYINSQSVWSISTAFSTWQTPSALLSATSNSSGGAYTATLTINTTGGVVANPYPSLANMSEATNARVVALNGSTKVVFTVTERNSGTSLVVRTSSANVSSIALTNLTF